MLRARIIPCLLVHNRGLVKTARFSAPKYVGDPLNAVRIFNEKEVDELIVLDIDATTKGRDPDYDLIRNLAAECRMPMCYGGGVTTVAQATRIIGLGVEKVSLSAAALSRPALVSEMARYVGSQSIVVVLDVRYDPSASAYTVWSHNGTRRVTGSPEALGREFEARGAGEIVINSIDADGAMTGYDMNLARRVRAAVSVPLTILGGAGSLDDIRSLVAEFGMIGAAAGSLFVFKGTYRAVLINYPSRAQKQSILAAAPPGGAVPAGQA